MPKYTVILGELKEHRVIISRIKQALRKHEFSLIFIFPTLSLLKAVQEELLREPDVGGIGGVRFLLFEGFIEELTRRFGIEGRRPTAIEQDLLIIEAFNCLDRAGKLNYLNRVPFTAGYRRAVLEGIREWKRAGLTPEIFMEWAEGQGPKEQQLASVYQLYQRLLTERGLLEEDLILNRLEKLRSEARQMPETIPVVMYGFTDLTPLQNDYLKVLEFWFDFELIIDPTTIPEFQGMVRRHFSIKFPEYSPPPSNTALETLQNSFWTKEPSAANLAAADQSLQMIQAAGPLREAAGIAREITGLLRENGYGADDFLIIAPNPQEFVKTAGPIFREYGLNIIGADARNARQFPAVNQFHELLTACGEGWQWPEMELLIRHFAGTASDGGDRFALWIGERYGAVSGRERWLELAVDESFIQDATGAGFDLKPLQLMLEWLGKIPERALFKEYLVLAGEWFRAQSDGNSALLPTDPELLRLAAGNYRAAQAAVAVLEEIAQFIAKSNWFQHEVGVKEFQEFLENIWPELPVETAERRIRSVKVIPPREARGLRAAVVFITGLEQGVFPRVYINDWKLTPAARRELRALGIELETGEQYQLQEKLAFYWALHTAGHRLYLVYRDQDGEGQPNNRSIFLDEILQWFPELGQRVIRYGLAPGIRNSYAVCYSGIECRERLVVNLMLSKAVIAPGELAATRELLQVPENRSLALRLRRKMERRYGGTIRLSEHPEAQLILNARFGDGHRFSITAIEDYRSCPYRFFLKHLLKVRPAVKPALLPELLDLGNIYHAILRQFGKKFRGQTLRRAELERYQAALEECLREQCREWRKWTGSELAALILSLLEAEIRRTLKRWLETELEWAEATAGRFQIQKVEWSFGSDGFESEPEALAAPYQLEDGSISLKIWGRIDRVDADRKGNFVVYDYKLGKGPSCKDLLELKQIQIPVYLLALEQLWRSPGKAVGGSYLGLKEPSRTNGGVWHRERLGPLWKGKSLITQTEWSLWLDRVKAELTAAVSGIRSGRFDLTREECPKYCEYQNCCRRLEREVEESNGRSA